MAALPSFALEPLEQSYRRMSDDVYRYESAAENSSRAEGERSALPLTYENLWIAES